MKLPYSMAEPKLDRKTQSKLDAHDDYRAAVERMKARMPEMANRAAMGDEFARGWVAAMHEMSLAIQEQLARRIS